MNHYGFTGQDRALYGGWTMRTMGELGSSAQERYAENVWRNYFPKLLKKSVYYKDTPEQTCEVTLVS
jgi:hypothetical protein